LAACWREEPLEVDGVVQGRSGAWAVGIKTSAFDRRDLTGLLGSRGDEVMARRLGLDAISWVDFRAAGFPAAP
jgi:hypothetical protein